MTPGSSLAYPLVMASGVGLHLLLVAAGVPFQASAYACIAVGALAVALLERGIPHRREWHGRAVDFTHDTLYLVWVQTLLPFVLAISLSVYATRGLAGLGAVPEALWPHTWPVPLQALLMLLAADFLRYWLHDCTPCTTRRRVCTG